MPIYTEIISINRIGIWKEQMKLKIIEQAEISL